LSDPDSLFLPDIEFEVLEEDISTGSLTYSKAMLAGAVAGTSEHVIMFPVDTIKTQLQQPGGPRYRNVLQGILSIVKKDGPIRLYRGLPATVLSAFPSHGVYFATYELCKNLFGGTSGTTHKPIQTAAAGAMGVMCHDAVVTPFDVVKQRLQMDGSQYRGIRDCIKSMLRKEGLRAFFQSYPTTVLMNSPVNGVQFASYESLKIFFMDATGHSGPLQQAICGGCAGSIAGVMSTPIDVIKTRLQLQILDRDCPRRRLGPIDMSHYLIKNEGIKSFFKGAGARAIMAFPSHAICWTIYEAMKRLLRRKAPSIT